MYIPTVHYWEREYHGPLARVEAVAQPTMHWLPIDAKQCVYTVGPVKDSYLEPLYVLPQRGGCTTEMGRNVPIR